MTKMTIQTFSRKTGLSPSALRFYEDKKLLRPEERGENGYRYYAEEQIPLARMIHTFRQTGVPVGDIRSFLQASPEEQEGLIDRWHRDTENKLRELQVAKQYLGGARPGVRAVNLVRWEEPSLMVWFSHELRSMVRPYAQAIAEDRMALASAECETTAETFVFVLEAQGTTLHAEIGFRLSGGTSSAARASLLRAAERLARCRIEERDPMLFVTLDTRADDPLTCLRYSRMLDRYGFRPTGPRWERFETGLEERVLSYIPVLPAGQG